MSKFRWVTPIISIGAALSLLAPIAQAETKSSPSEINLEATDTNAELNGGPSNKLVAEPTPEELEAAYGSVENAPIFLGGETGGETTESANVEGIGEITATIDNETGEITTTYPDGSVETISAGDAAKEVHTLETQNRTATPNNLTAQTAGLDPHKVCPYVVSVIGTGAGLSLGAVLAAIGINPIAGVIAAMGHGAFMTYVSNNC